MSIACARCSVFVRPTDPRKIIDGKVYHLYCGWKVENEKRVPPPLISLGVQDANQVRPT